MKEKTFTLKKEDHTITGWVRIPDKAICRRVPLAVLMHGVTLDKNSMPLILLADQLIEEDIAVLSFDFYAHGEAGGKWENMTVAKWIEDGEEILRYTSTMSFISEIFFVGHSQGGLTASIVAGKHPDQVKAMALYAPAAVIEDAGKTGSCAGVEFNPHNIPEKVPFFSGYLGRKYFRSAQKLHVYETAEKYNGPVCILQGTSDELVPLSYAWKYHEVYNTSRLVLFSNGDHMFHDHRDRAAEVVTDFLMKYI